MNEEQLKERIKAIAEKEFPDYDYGVVPRHLVLNAIRRALLEGAAEARWEARQSERSRIEDLKLWEKENGL